MRTPAIRLSENGIGQAQKKKDSAMVHRLVMATAVVAATLALAAPAAATTPRPTPHLTVAAASVGAPGGAFPNVDVFYRRGDGRLVQRPELGSAVDLGGVITSAPAALSHAIFEFYGESVYARGADGAVWTRGYSDGRGEWGSWASLGGRVTGAPAVTCVLLAGEEVSRTVVYARGTNGSLWRSPEDGGWSDVQGRLLSDPAGLNAAFGVCPSAEAAYAIGADRSVWQYTRSGWTRVGGVSDVAPSATILPSGATEVAVRGTDGAAWLTTRAAGSATWPAFRRVGGHFTSPVTLVVDGRVPQSRLLYGLGTDGDLWQARNVIGTNAWTMSEVP
jgi:hypothetical protein